MKNQQPRKRFRGDLQESTTFPTGTYLKMADFVRILSVFVAVKGTFRYRNFSGLG